MSLYQLKLNIEYKTVELPPWVQFAFTLGAFLYDEGIKYRKHANVLVTVPNEQFFSLFVAIGIADKIFSTRKQMRAVRKQILDLSTGSRIIYSDGHSQRKVSVISIEESPVLKGEMILYIQDKNFKRGIPEKHWLDKIILLDEEFDDIKRTRIIGKNQQVGVNSPLLEELYSENQLSKISFYPGEKFYIVGNQKKLAETLYEKCFSLNEKKGAIDDFLYVENLSKDNSYVNGKFISSYSKNPGFEIDTSIPVIFSDATAYRKQSSLFPKNPSLIVVSRSDQEQRIMDVISDINRRIVQNEIQFITNEVLTYLESAVSLIPNGIELIVWREK